MVTGEVVVDVVSVVILFLDRTGSGALLVLR